MRIFLALFLTIGCCSGQVVIGNAVLSNVQIGPSGGGGGSCPPDGSPSQDNDATGSVGAIGIFNDNYYQGQSGWSDASARTICKIAWKLTYVSGTVTGQTYVTKIWSLNGTSLDTVLATSSGVSGSASWSATWVVFEFPTPYTTTGSASYAFTIDHGAADATKEIQLVFGTSTGAPGTHEVWNNLGAFQEGSSNDSAFRVYWQ